MCFDRCVQVLFDAFAVKNMPAFCLDSILRNIVAQPAYGGLHIVISKRTSILLAANYEIGVARHLSHARNQTEDIGVVCGCPSVISALPFGAKDSLLRSVPASTYVLNCRFASENRLRYNSFSSGLK
jgi:hypothetical protein